MKKLPVPLKFFLIGFAHILVALVIFAIFAIWGNLLFLLILPLALSIALMFFTWHIAKKNNNYKWLWLIIIGYLVACVLTYPELPTFYVFIPIFWLIDRFATTDWLYWGWVFFVMPITLVLVILECLILYTIKLISWLKNRKKGVIQYD